jgi:beta-lactamase superfamily II metal-dependent hydrolase
VPLHLDILDVGQGDGMVLWMPNGKVIMVDLGSTKNKGIVTDDSFKYFKAHTSFGKGGQVLEWLVLTHGDRDHYNMVEKFLTDFTVNLRNVLHGGKESDYGGLIDRLRKRKNPDGQVTKIFTGTNVGYFPLASKDDLGAEVFVLACGVEAAKGSEGYVKNTRSVVLRIVYAGIGLMLTGDATRDTEGAIFSGIPTGKNPRNYLSANVLKLAHHGSHRTSNFAAWIAAVDPNYAFVSSDRSGSLDEDQKATGHRLPQNLTFDLVRTYAKRLQGDCTPHSYVSAYEQSDYVQYNAAPDIRGQQLPIPIMPSTACWAQFLSSEGIFSTLAQIGVSKDPQDPGAADIGVQYRVTIEDNSDFRIETTDDFSSFSPEAKLGS